MKLFTNLPRALRIFFNVGRALVVTSVVLVLLVTCVGLFVRTTSSPNPFLVLPALGELEFGPDLKALGLGLTLDGASTPDLAVQKIRGELMLNLLARDRAFLAAALQAIVPALLVGVTFAWLILGRLRDLCANLERGEIFSEKNLLLVRGLGGLLIFSSLSEGVFQFWVGWPWEAISSPMSRSPGSQP